ncbi:MAG: hypothetical protein JWQ10_1299 [Herbaspirillum sp.]|jgi:hypothetical protein|nr:hypothetical protein [Herbaspirillum sp.]
MSSITKLVSAIAVIVAVTQTPASFAATKLTGCAAKRDAITTQIQQAQDNPERKAGLEKALDEVNAHCRDTTLDKQRNRKIIRAQVKVNEAERALHKAESEHRSEEKLGKLRAKYESAKAELAEAEAALQH